MANIVIDIQQAATGAVPDNSELVLWAKAALNHEEVSEAEVTLRLVDLDEMISLNGQYRKKHMPTNVLSFPAEMELGDIAPDDSYIGDIVICAPVIVEEAKRDAVLVSAHWAHMVIHGILHLLGYDHVDATEAELMEGKEVVILASLGFGDPYQ